MRSTGGHARVVLIQAIKSARDLVRNVVDFELLDHLLDLRQGTTITSRHRLTERNSLPNHLEVRAADTAILCRLGFCAALRTVHNSRNVSEAVLVPSGLSRRAAEITYS